MKTIKPIHNETEVQNFYPGFKPVLQKDDKKATIFIWAVSIIVFTAVALLSKIKFNVDLGFNPHLFAKANAYINFIVTILLLFALWAVKTKNYLLHKRIMITAIILSVLFLVSYICHHLFAGETRFGDIDHNGIISADEKMLAVKLRIVYYILLARITYPIWLYVAISGVTVYLMISPYYN